MDYLTEREIFDRVKDHLLTQNKKSLSSTEDCMYRGEEGAMCAVGCLISDELYDPTIEGLAVDSMNYCEEDTNAVFRSALYGSRLNIEDDRILVLLRKLQTIHDTSNPYMWEEELDRLEKSDVN